ncbi:HugZ family protein [Pokkaliibacter sp. CJK22405]|uniref:HugZ family pyridoxamine 5'-phosphate oxidase n=1 Tax=Pokkaliibacter sp. CJK22405 TaxID=3384615 RepID=UPI003984D5E3
MPDSVETLLQVFDDQLAFRRQCRSVMMATVSCDGGAPHVSYAPCIEDEDGHLFIQVSELAAHTRNLLAGSSIKVMFIQDEASSPVIHARERLTLDVTVKEISREEVEWNSTIQAFIERFGEVAKTLSSLDDFHIFKLTPESGVYVKGFAKAYRVYPDGIEHIRDLGHRNISV